MTSTAEFTVARSADQDEILHLRGELDMANTHHLRCHICAVLHDRDPARLVLDLSELDFIDSSGLAVMLWAHFRLTGRGHLLCLAAPHAHVLRVLRVTGMHQRLHIYPTIADALHAPLPECGLALRPSVPAGGEGPRGSGRQAASVL
jgi:anti-sigma B factor antagonist